MEDNNQKISSEEWLRKIKAASEKHALKQEQPAENSSEQEEEKTGRNRTNGMANWLIPLTIFFLALVPRLYFLFFVGQWDDPGVSWYADTFHHWQIAYLSKTVGFSHGFLRLWDFKGLEYFWGALHPLVLAFLFTITGSTTILVPRLLSTFMGVFNVILFYLLAKRYFNLATAIATAIFASFFPVMIYSDVSGMQEPLGIFFLLLGVYAWPKKPFLTGLAWGLASMARGEYWVFTLGLAAALLVFGKSFEKKIIALIFYAIPVLLYMKYLSNWSGNAIYPIYWNFFANAAGKWQGAVPLDPHGAETAKIILTILLVLAVLGVITTLKKKSENFLLLLLGFGNWIFLSIFVGWTAYLRSYIPRFWVDRIFLLAYLFLGLLVAAFLFYWSRNLIKNSKLRNSLGWIIVVIITISSQYLWNLIWFSYTHTPINNQKTTLVWMEETQLADDIKKFYKGGNILIPFDRTVLTYLLVNREKFTGPQIVGSMYDPFYYNTQGDPYRDWGKFRKKMFKWLKDNNIKLIASYYNNKNYTRMYEREPKVFKKLSNFWINIYEVNL